MTPSAQDQRRMVASTEEFCTLLSRSRLIPAEEVELLARRWSAEKTDATEAADKFAKWLVGRDVLTPYQSAALLRGHADHFFLDEYKLLDRVGAGRMAGVFKAVHRLGQVVAVKVLPPSKSKIDEAMGRFMREARIAVRFRHPNVVRTYQLGEAMGLHYLVMEYLQGETLDEVLKRRGKLPAHEATRILYQALLGLQHLHEHGVVHRDLKPGNLMLVPRPPDGQDTTLEATVKILDVGLGRALFDENDPWGSDENFQLTAAGAVLGDPDYISPEQVKDSHGADVRADIYAMGGILFHALGGEPPFPDKNPLRKFVRHATEKPRLIRELNPAVPEKLETLIQRMLAKDPAQRPATPQIAADALRPFLAAPNAKKAAATTPAPPTPTATEKSFLDYVEKEPVIKVSEGSKVSTAASLHTWRSLVAKLADDSEEEVYQLEGANPKPKRSRPVLDETPEPEPEPTFAARESIPLASVVPEKPSPRPQQPVVRQAMPAPVRNVRPTPAPAARPMERPAPVQQAETAKPAPRRVVAVLAEEEAAAEQPVAAPAADEQPSTRRDVRLILLGASVGAGLILLAGGLGLLIAHVLTR